jgi:ubiquinol-cytochrome c reductase cytochrome c1 subunit
MNKELKILAIVVFFSILTYIGVEPFAHSQMHKHVEGHNFAYDGTADIEEASKEKKEAKEAFWADVKKIAALQGDAAAGEGTYAMCAGCHMEGAANMGGVIPPSLEKAGSLYDKNYLIALIKDPAMASNVDHKYKDTMTHPMGSIKTMVTEPQDIANVVAYLLEKKTGEVTPKEAFLDACGRCHANQYGNITQLGETPKFKYEKDALAHKIKVLEEQDLVKGYMGKLPPDLSMIIRARSHHFLETFIENPQSQLPGTSMPRVGLSKEGFEKVMAYLENTGDHNKPARDSLGWKVILFFIIFSVLAYLWKKQVWSKLH